MLHLAIAGSLVGLLVMIGGLTMAVAKHAQQIKDLEDRMSQLLESHSRKETVEKNA